MTFISYAQNYEDVMLWRALKHIENGFYIDVGAQDPVIESVTKAFYDRGWRGINIEPSAQWFEKLQQKRPEDTNLKVAAGAKEGELTFYEIPDTGLSTLDQSIAEEHAQNCGYLVNTTTVAVRTITSICDESEVQTIHFLKIDVEGAEKDVLEGIDFSKIRPWIIVVESTLPNTQIESHQALESIILDSKYKYAYFDGLNRFYIAEEQSELLLSFQSPPNWFDHFKIVAQHSAETRAEQAETRAEQTLAQLQDVLSSKSWRYTKPLRIMGSLTRIIVNSTVSFIKRMPSTVLKSILGSMLKITFLKPLAVRLLNRFPTLKFRLKRLINRSASEAMCNQQLGNRNQNSTLSASAERIYNDLLEAIEKRGQK